MGLANRIYFSKARKNYMCNECGRIIKKGDMYIRHCSTLLRMGWAYGWASGCDILCIKCAKAKFDKRNITTLEEFERILFILKRRYKWIEPSDIDEAIKSNLRLNVSLL